MPTTPALDDARDLAASTGDLGRAVSELSDRHRQFDLQAAYAVGVRHRRESGNRRAVDLLELAIAQGRRGRRLTEPAGFWERPDLHLTLWLVIQAVVVGIRAVVRDLHVVDVLGTLAITGIFVAWWIHVARQRRRGEVVDVDEVAAPGRLGELGREVRRRTEALADGAGHDEVVTGLIGWVRDPDDGLERALRHAAIGTVDRQLVASLVSKRGSQRQVLAAALDELRTPTTA